MAPLSDEDVVVFGQWVVKVGLENLPQVQPKQVACTGVGALVQALKGAQVCLVHSEDYDSDTRVIDTSRDSLPWGCYSSDSLNLEAGYPSDLEDGEVMDRSRPSEPMDQSDTLGHGLQPTGDVASNASVALVGMSHFQSEDMDTTAQPSEAESHSDIPTTGQYARSRQVGPPDSAWGEGESETSRRHRQYSKIPLYLVFSGEMIENWWFEGEDIMNPREVATPVHRVGKPNIDGSIGGDKGYPLPHGRPDREYFHGDRELIRRITYPHSKRDHLCSPITEQECLKSAAPQDKKCAGVEYWEEVPANSKYLPTPEDSPVNFSYRDAGSTLTVPYHVVGTMVWEYTYHSSHSQEDLSDQLVPESLCGLKVVRPGYFSAFDRPATSTQATAACDSGKGYADHISDTDVNKHVHPEGYVGHQGRALLV